MELMPDTFEEAASALNGAAQDGHTLRISGAGTKLGWGNPVPDPDIELRTTALSRIVEHNEGDLTAVLEAGVSLEAAQAKFASAGQMLALDPPLGLHGERAATIGGVLATGDCGPLRHRYGAPRDLVLGVTVALADGTLARSGGKVIKNVAGYDLAKLFAGSFGTLGAILSVSVRLHPRPLSTATALGATGSPEILSAAAVALAGAPLELDALDFAWRGGRGGLLARCSGADPSRRAQRALELMRAEGIEQHDLAGDDEALWERQRAGQRSSERALVRIAARPSALATVVEAADRCAGTLVGRAALGISYLELDPNAVGGLLRSPPAGARCTVLDAPAELRAEIDPWGPVAPGALALMQRIKQRFDPGSVCAPGVFAGAI
ncbi:MAG TPA: FAD-binding oxidoreductase [Solirubrobacteraceae bacterium]|nr:FAD-binding oxidoreductase [Solirubrobacteraceae bacterium]